jgi:DHA2 family multidrug resistance protein
LLTTFLARSAQVNQTALSANVVAGSNAVHNYVSTFAAGIHSTYSAARPLAMAQMYQQMLAQSSMLAYRSAFFILAVVVFSLSPLVWIMRLPPKNAAPPDPELAGH